jgi:hypothetical protein
MAPTIAIIGSGQVLPPELALGYISSHLSPHSLSGMTLAIECKRQLGINSLTIYEKAVDVGGTWRDNVGVLDARCAAASCAG